MASDGAIASRLEDAVPTGVGSSATSDPPCCSAESTTVDVDWQLVEGGAAEVLPAEPATDHFRSPTGPSVETLACAPDDAVDPGVAVESDVAVEPSGAVEPDGSEHETQDAAATSPELVEDPSGSADTPTGNAELDLCFLCDCTGSMGSYIRAAQQNICDIVEKIETNYGAAVRFGLISYRDHPPQDSTYVTRVHPFTDQTEDMKQYVSTMFAAGGGDGPEAVTAALSDALWLPWRPNSTKIVILIADAPPHGLEPHGDGFPNGDPEGRDPLDIARQMAADGIVCYCVGCEPALGRYQFARDFMCSLAEMTGGQAVALSSAALLADVIVNGSAEEISLTRLQREVEAEVEAVRENAERSAKVLSDKDCARIAALNLQERSVRSTQMHTDGSYVNSAHAVWHSKPAQTLASAKAELCATLPVALPPPTGFFSGGGGGSGGMSASMGAGYFMAPPPPAHAAYSSASIPVPMSRGMGGCWGPMSEPDAMMGSFAAAGPSIASSHRPAQQQTTTMNLAREDLISVGQVERLMHRKQLQKHQSSSV